MGFHIYNLATFSTWRLNTSMFGVCDQGGDVGPQELCDISLPCRSNDLLLFVSFQSLAHSVTTMKWHDNSLYYLACTNFVISPPSLHTRHFYNNQLLFYISSPWTFTFIILLIMLLIKLMFFPSIIFMHFFFAFQLIIYLCPWFNTSFFESTLIENWILLRQK